ncbi:hypothetical protein EGI22_18430 [Lacihabitans sp. LS3-19]|uniref:hypothetical protein n=1 Tax=Lacihabitans sp. LS3-19 TaxID=2487335 RepID=UPI0020CF7F28|nr:hypothetical protein [Lacihabitans sp. LS3-19]MCP9769886.1 hypothetical protein [Lacihabitans sp. LS3-19]
MKTKLLFKTRKSPFYFLLVPFVLIFFITSSCKEQTEATKSPIALSPDIPVDVDPVLQAELKAKNDNYYQLNQAFNKYSWQAIVAIFWPYGKDQKPMPSFTDKGKPYWLTWKEAMQVYRPDGGEPAKWDGKRIGKDLGLENGAVAEEDIRIYLSSETPAHKGKAKFRNFADETDQAFAGELFDQNGNVVLYEVLMNKAEYEYLVANKLYNINGQIEFTSKNQIANFPPGDFKTNQVGAVEIKFAWKVLQETDIKERYFVNKGYVVDEKTKKLVIKDLGMIGFHISQKTPTGKQWVWSTFEQIDNLDQNVVDINGIKKTIHPTLTDPNCELCPVNINVVDANGTPTTFTYNSNEHSNYWLIKDNPTKFYANTNIFKTQAKRMIDIPVRVQDLNKEMQAYFKSQNSVFQYYQLIDTQYPIDQNVLPANSTEKGYKLPESATNKPGGNPNLAFLTNITMETFFQIGNQPASAFMEANPKSDIQVFGTESCMGCHSSAGIYNGVGKNNTPTTLPQLSGDFSWLLTQKAQWYKPKK